MKTNRIQKTLAVALVAGLTAAGSAWAWGPGDCGMGGKGDRGGRMGNVTPEQMQERMDARRTAKMERLASALSLQDAQKPAWDTFKAALQEHANARTKFFAEQSKAEVPASALARLDRATAFNTFQKEQLGQMREALQAFYGQLSDAQKTVFDTEFQMTNGPRGMRGGPRGMGGMGGMGGMQGMGAAQQ